MVLAEALPDLQPSTHTPPTRHPHATNTHASDMLQTRFGHASDTASASIEEHIWHVVGNIPWGTVATYGQVARLAGLPRGARRVGRVLARLPPGSRLPWHRVVNARGRVSLGGAAGRDQEARLRDEGVEFHDGRISLARFRWAP